MDIKPIKTEADDQSALKEIITPFNHRLAYTYG
jgi:hypothetical protein